MTIPVTMLPRLRSDERIALASAGRFWLNIMGRLRPGVTIAQADAEFQTVWAQALAATVSPDSQPKWTARYLTSTSGLEPGAAGYSPVRRQFQAALWLLFGLVALVLVVACATVANLVLAAAAGRRRELALGSPSAPVARAWFSSCSSRDCCLPAWAARSGVSSRPGPPSCSCGCCRPATTRCRWRWASTAAWSRSRPAPSSSQRSPSPSRRS